MGKDVTLHNLPSKHNLRLDSCTNLHLVQLWIAKNVHSKRKQIHSFITRRGFAFATSTFIQNTLINMYVNCGSLMAARKVFDDMRGEERDSFSWNVMIAAYRRDGDPQEALTLFHHMQLTPVSPDQITFATILPACAKIRALELGIHIHQSIVQRGFLSDVVVANALLDMYSKCGNISKARELFDKMPQRDVISWNVMIAGYAQNNVLDEASRLFREMPRPDVVSWNAMLAGYAQNGFFENAFAIFRQMQSTGFKPNSTTFASILSACAKVGALEQGMDVHQSIIESGLLSDVLVVNALIDMYAKCGDICKARELFDKMPQRDVVSMTAIITGFTHNGFVEEALETFKQIHLTGVKPNSTTFASILSACAKMGALEQGMSIHQRLIESVSLSDIVVTNALVDMYAKCGSIRKACELFGRISQRDVVSWNVMTAGYAQNGFVEKALESFKQMQMSEIKANSTTFAGILTACAKMGALEQGMDIHQSIIESGFMCDAVVVNALVDMYSKCESIPKARKLFDKMSQRDLASWNAMIMGYTQNGLVEKALETFKQMQLDGIMPNSATFATILPACAKVGALEQGMDIHQCIIECGLLSDVVVASALVDMYAKCGSIHMARKLFDKMAHQDVVSWTSMIAGYAQNGFCQDALILFDSMKCSGCYPNHVSFTCVLFACSHAGLVDEGCRYFNDMSESYCIMPGIDHYVCMVDLVGRAGYLEETLNFIIKMPIKPPGVVWMSLLGACRSHKKIGLGLFTTNILVELDPKNAATYVHLSNIYADVGRWGEVHKVRRLMEHTGTKKTPGCSWIEVHKVVHAFCVGDRSHPQTQEIYAKLEKLSREMKAAGYFPDSSRALNDVEEEEKELFICHHSEKLAIAFGLLFAAPGTTIRVFKNLRVCADCHTATKFISKIVARQIVVRDVSRFHHFKQGKCSCGDYW
ncbi:pentatricopeptide repeat-containing protein At3g26782, mitochondrial [Cryptomeria japonica]|uniref:pentatricopeptide repeat-containing protein At3g26782, mitochondrial n=1 Tax=Cryptomeria japonica TaxID=3369 RepID=UPI0027D9E93E|nr:pentatricopeptide repeat-containing protein At3g26782, mitochondrial [Cryptomeria japonica]